MDGEERIGPWTGPWSRGHSGGTFGYERRTPTRQRRNSHAPQVPTPSLLPSGRANWYHYNEGSPDDPAGPTLRSINGTRVGMVVLVQESTGRVVVPRTETPESHSASDLLGPQLNRGPESKISLSPVFLRSLRDRGEGVGK